MGKVTGLCIVIGLALIYVLRDQSASNATTKGALANGPSVERCISCHRQVESTHPTLDGILGKESRHSFTEIGCAVCHGGSGAARDRETAHAGLVPTKYAQGRCVVCHRETQFLKGAPQLARAERLYRDAGCGGCHEPQALPTGPSLKRIRDKLTPEWTRQWLAAPAGSRMPYHFGDNAAQEIADIATYLFTKSESRALSAAPAGDAAKGKDLFESVGCLGCHASPSEKSRPRFEFGPDLAGLASKTHAKWIFQWLRDPKSLSPHTRMPSLRLSAREAGDITAYLMTLVSSDTKIETANSTELSRGHALIDQQACYGCHEITGFEGKKPPVPLLKGLMSKSPFHFDSKDPYQVVRDRLSRRGARMPDYRFSDTELDLIMVKMTSLTDDRPVLAWEKTLSPRETSYEKAMKVVHEMNCQGCHVVAGMNATPALEGRVLSYYHDDETLGPPPLQDEGRKVFPSWLSGFLRAPFPLRAGLAIRMPSFQWNENDLQNLVVGWTSQAGPNSAAKNTSVPPNRVGDRVGDGGRLFAQMQCLGCHGDATQVATAGGAQGFAPPFRHALGRLRREWIVEWLRDPQKLQPGTRMPSFWPEGISPVPEILDGDAEKQIQALTDYLLSHS